MGLLASGFARGIYMLRSPCASRWAYGKAGNGNDWNWKWKPEMETGSAWKFVPRLPTGSRMAAVTTCDGLGWLIRPQNI